MNSATEEMLRTHRHGSMQVLRHHIYEYQKGIRHLILHTCSARFENEIIRLLNKKNVNYFIQFSSDQKINVFFGDQKCVNILKRIGQKSLSEFTDEEDFMLGIMLGYDQLKQCERYLKRKNMDFTAKALA